MIRSARHLNLARRRLNAARCAMMTLRLRRRSDMDGSFMRFPRLSLDPGVERGVASPYGRRAGAVMGCEPF